MSCSFNCSAPAPALSPNSDITGIGIIINNIVTAGFVVVIVSLHYITVHDPTCDPFRKDDQNPQIPYRPNPIDVNALAQTKLVLWHAHFVSNGSEKLTNFLLKCIRAFSDIQIVTGFSILISGFLQLRCGLATYHWLVIVHLAWISCITQLSCLSLLRKHLRDHPTERVLRLLAVGVLVILLIVGLSFTGNYHWAFDAGNSDHPTLSDSAICYLHPRPEMNSAFLSMPYSMIILIFGFSSRVIIVYDTLSVRVVGRARSFLSKHIRRLLRIVYDWGIIYDRSEVSSSPRSLKQIFCYLPLLSVYFTCWVLVDVWDSTVQEVLWFITAFVYGIGGLMTTIYRPEKMGLEASLTGFNEWTFGQVASVVLLAAPLITVIEYFQEDDTPVPDTTLVQETSSTKDEPPAQETTPAQGTTPTPEMNPAQETAPTQEMTPAHNEALTQDELTLAHDETPTQRRGLFHLSLQRSIFWSIGRILGFFIFLRMFTVLYGTLRVLRGSKESVPPAQDETPAQDEEPPLFDNQPESPPEIPSTSNPNFMDLNDPDNDWALHPKISDQMYISLANFVLQVISLMAKREISTMKGSSLDGTIDVLCFSGLWVFVLILFSLMAETIFAERRPTLNFFLHGAVKMYSVIFANFHMSLWAKLVYCFAPFPILSVLACLFWD